jgi:tetratricopeptide (TPR) repeat protein
MKQALALDPLSPNMNADLGQICYFAHEYDQAIAQCQKTLDLDPAFLFAHEYLFHIYGQKGMYPEAVEAYLKAREFARETPATANTLMSAYSASGWQGFLKSLVENNAARNSAANRAGIYAMIGDKEHAILELEKAYDQRDFFLAYIQVEPMYDSLRSDPRFADLLRRMRFSS